MSISGGSSDRILILGDETKSAGSLERILRAAGYDAFHVVAAESARELLEERDYSLVIIDPSASRLSGTYFQSTFDESGESLRRMNWANKSLELCREIRRSKSPSELPVMVVSKSQRPQDKITCLNAGASDFLSKPYQRAELLSRVRAHLRSWHFERDRTERFEQLNVLHAVSSVLTSSLDPDALARGTLEVLLKNLQADAGVVYLRSQDTGAMSVVAARGFVDNQEERSGLIALYKRTAPLMDGKPFLLEPVPDSARAGLPQGILEGVHGMVCAPIGLAGNTVGAICLFSHKATPFPNQQAELLSTICNQLSIALDNARLYVETKKSAAQLAFVYNLGNNLMTSLEMDELLGLAVFTVGKSLECDVCAVVVRSLGESEEMDSAIYSRMHGQRGEADEWYHTDRVLNYLTTTDRAVQPSVEVRVVDRFLRDEDIRFEMVVPLMFDDRMLGMMICASYESRSFSADDQKLLGAVAQRLSLAIRNTELYQRTKDTSINLAVEVSRRTREIEEQRRFTEKIIDSLPVSLYVIDRDMNIVAWNRNRELGGQGISRDEVLGRNVFDVLARQPRRMLEEEFTEVFRTGKIVRLDQESYTDGQKKYWNINKIPMRVDNAEVSHVITVGEDITEQKKMNEAVIHAEKLASIGRLAAGVVHELNNPLATIAACSEALIARLDDLKEQSSGRDFGQYLEIIREEAFRCKTITNSLLDFSHQRQAEKFPGDINQIIEHTLQLTRHHPKLGNLKLVKELNLSLGPVYVNEGQMKQIFIALISNSFDAMDGEGTLTIRTSWHQSDQERSVAVEFIDTGCGIPAAHLQKIFDPFFTTKPLGRGTGLGLSVCYGIVSEHGGRIEVDSVEDQGSTFRVLLPVIPDVAHIQAKDTQATLNTENIR
jgi:two-component system NtrC family sensor kinase